MEGIDFEKLRSDLIDYLGTAFYAGYGVAIVEISDVERASNEELIELAQKYGFNLENYQKYARWDNLVFKWY